MPVWVITADCSGVGIAVKDTLRKRKEKLFKIVTVNSLKRFWAVKPRVNLEHSEDILLKCVLAVPFVKLDLLHT